MEPFVVVDAGTLDDRTPGDVVILPPATAKHLRTVLRRGVGSGLVLSDGAGRTVDAELTLDGARCVGEPEHTPAPSPGLHVLQAVAKGRKVDEVVRTLTEMGVDAVTPVAAERSIKEVAGPKRDRTVARWLAVATAAAEQSRRPHVPTIGEPGTVAEVLERYRGADGDSRIIAAQVGATTPLSEAVRPRLRDAARVVLAVGPEGGWTPAEVAAFAAAGADVVTMGPSVLRTEHAGVVLSAVIAFALGRMD